MNQKTKYITGIVLSVLVICALTIPAFALTESDVQSQVSASGKEGVAGNLFVWFLCAVAFLKISQKIDSFMQGLGINVGHTGGSMLAEAMLAARSIAAARGVAGRGRGGNAGRAGSTGGGDSNTFLQGGLAGVANRSFYNGAYRNATGTGSGGVGGMAFRASMTKGGDIANNVISRIATGGAGSGDVVSSNMAADALKSYMGYTALGEGAADIPNFSNVEISGGHITGTETSEEEPDGRAFAMYSTEQYMEPKREYTRFISELTQHFNEKYSVTISTDAIEEHLIPAEPDPYRCDMDTSKEYHRNLRALSLHYEDVVDQMFIQLDGLSFVERAYQELRIKCYKAAHSYNDKPSYDSKGDTLRFGGYFCTCDENWGREDWSLADRMKDVLAGVAYFETNTFGCKPAGFSELLGYSAVSTSVFQFPDCQKLIQLRMFKNGRVDLKFKTASIAKEFAETYLDYSC